MKFLDKALNAAWDILGSALSAGESSGTPVKSNNTAVHTNNLDLFDDEPLFNNEVKPVVQYDHGKEQYIIGSLKESL
jgi:hypothetical protein